MEAEESSTVNSSRKKGVSRLVAATRYSAAGLRAAIRSEEAVRQEIAVLIVAIPLAFWLGETAVDKVVLIGSVGLVLIVELLNTAVETVVDRVGRDYHELSRVAKDVGSATVFLAMLLGFFAWIMILAEKFGVGGS